MELLREEYKQGLLINVSILATARRDKVLANLISSAALEIAPL
jgi:hypothetical protein